MNLLIVRSKWPKFLLPFLIVFVNSCSFLSRKPSNNEEDFSLEDALSREASSLPTKNVFLDKRVEFLMESDRDIIVRELPGRGILEIKSSIGSQIPMLCYLKKEKRPQLANTLITTYESLKPKVTETNVAKIDAGLIRNSPYLILFTQYLLEAEQTQKVGLLKMMSISHGQNAILCLHDEYGYQNTFIRVVENFILTTKFLDDSQSSQLAKLSKEDYYLFENDHYPMGFISKRTFLDEKGRKNSEIQTSYLQLATPQNLNATDVTVTTLSDQQGVIQSGYYEKIFNQEKKYGLEMSRSKESKSALTIKGTVNKQKFHKKILTPEILGDEDFQFSQLKRYWQEDQRGRSLKHFGYNPEINPNALISVESSFLSFDQQSQQLSVKQLLESNTYQTLYDKQGREKEVSYFSNLAQYKIHLIMREQTP